MREGFHQDAFLALPGLVRVLAVHDRAQRSFIALAEDKARRPRRPGSRLGNRDPFAASRPGRDGPAQGAAGFTLATRAPVAATRTGDHRSEVRRRANEP